MGGAGGTLQYVRGNYYPLKGTNLTVAARRHPYHLPGIVYYSGRFDVRCGMWSCSVTTIEHEREKCESSVF